jgi:hypothetical protein
LVGILRSQLREWRVNLVTSYDFSEGALNGFGVGGAYRHQSKAAVGYPLQMSADGILLPVLTDPFFGPNEYNIDLFASYRRPITDKIDWKILLNVRNAFVDSRMIHVVINPDGKVAVVRNSNPMGFFITNTFSF